MTVIRQTCLLILASITIGCGRDADPVPFRTGTMIVLNQSEAAGWTPPEPPDVRVIKPTQRQRFRRGDPIACVATVTLSEGGQLPDFVTAEVQKQGVVYDACSMEPDQKLGGRQYQFKGKMKAPSRT